jgi:uncharacterized protein (DUF433 family)/DNA-binding transcriptional MerR regulator
VSERWKSDTHPALSAEQQREIRERLSRPIGRYDAERASQLSGVPERTVHRWAAEGVVTPDYLTAPTTHWSYRDLVLLRLAAWLRSKAMEPVWVGERTKAVKEWLEEPKNEIAILRSQGQSMIVGDETIDRLTGEMLIPQVVSFISVWSVFESLPHGRRQRLWGPDLIKPTRRVRIIPWVMAGEPCVEGTRVPTSTLFAIHQQRGLAASKITQLYPTLSVDEVVDAIELEGRLRKLPTAA